MEVQCLVNNHPVEVQMKDKMTPIYLLSPFKFSVCGGETRGQLDR